jgi:hypothetical protein
MRNTQSVYEISSRCPHLSSVFGANVKQTEDGFSIKLQVISDKMPFFNILRLKMFVCVEYTIPVRTSLVSFCYILECEDMYYL